jgi:hypothetical protein
MREAIALATRDTLRRRMADHLIRADAARLPQRLIRQLYEARHNGLEQAVHEVLTYIGLAAKRVLRQPQGEPDIVLEHGGSVLISVTASEDDASPVAWRKVREVLGAGAGMNPINCVCIARPGFQTRAEQAARDLAREESQRRLLLVPVPVLGELLVRYAQGQISGERVGSILATQRGVLDEARIDEEVPRGPA